jgi:sodium/potassium-transporting ATPase subunit alpha
MFLEQMIDPFSLFMWFLTALSFLEYGLSMDSNSLFLAIIILVTIVTSAFVSYSFTKDSSDVIKKFKDIVPQFANIRRNGVLRTIKSEDLVPGDIIEIPPGELIPADVRIIESNGMNVNDNIFTGESILKEIIP